jgi:hypothetical protein
MLSRDRARFLEDAKLLTHIGLIIIFFSLSALMMTGLDLTFPQIELVTGTEDSRRKKMLRTGEEMSYSAKRKFIFSFTQPLNYQFLSFKIRSENIGESDIRAFGRACNSRINLSLFARLDKDF